MHRAMQFLALDAMAAKEMSLQVSRVAYLSK